VESYGKRLHRAARKDFKTFWSAHRRWSTFIALLATVAGVLLQMVFLGVGSVARVELTVTTAVASLIVSLIGHYLIAMRRGAEMLDTELRNETEAEVARRVQESSLGWEPGLEHNVRLRLDRLPAVIHKLLEEVMVDGPYAESELAAKFGDGWIQMAVDERLLARHDGKLQVPSGISRVLSKIIYEYTGRA